MQLFNLNLVSELAPLQRGRVDHGAFVPSDKQIALQVFNDLVEALPEARASLRQASNGGSHIYEDLVLYKLHRLQAQLHTVCITSKAACEALMSAAGKLKKETREALLWLLDALNDYMLSDYIRLASRVAQPHLPARMPPPTDTARPPTPPETSPSRSRPAGVPPLAPSKGGASPTKRSALLSTKGKNAATPFKSFKSLGAVVQVGGAKNAGGILKKRVMIKDKLAEKLAAKLGELEARSKEGWLTPSRPSPIPFDQAPAPPADKPRAPPPKQPR